MAAAINFFVADDLNLNGSGIGFYGDSFGASVAVNAFQNRTYVTNSAGTAQGAECDNVKYVHPSSGILGGGGGGSATILTAIPNYQSTLNIRFTNDTAVKTQTCKLRIYDRSNIDNNPSGVTTKVAEIIHPGLTQVNDGSGSSTWQTPMGSGSVMTLTASPGMSGFRPNGAGTTADRHDWYVAISASPDSIGSKTLYGLYFSTEYL